MSMLPTPPKLSASTAPRLNGPVCLCRIDISANPNWNSEIPEHADGACLVRYGIQILRAPEQTGFRQVKLVLELTSDGKDRVPNSYVGKIEELADILFPKPELVTDEEQDQAAAWLATSVLVGSARAHLDLITSIGPYPRVTLSPVNRTNLIGRASLVEPNSKTLTPIYPDYEASIRTQNTKIMPPKRARAPKKNK